MPGSGKPMLAGLLGRACVACQNLDIPVTDRLHELALPVSHLPLA
jgi:hypothetical protein